MNVKGVVLGLLLVLAMATAAQARIVEYEEGSAGAASLVIVPQILDDAKVLADGQVAPSEY